MQCPYFRNISFQRIQQIMKQQSLADLDDVLSHQNKNISIKNDPFNDFSESISKEGLTGCLQHYQSKINLRRQQNVCQNIIETDRIISIKKPNIMNVKNLQKMQSQMINDESEQNIPNIRQTHIFQVRKMSNLNMPLHIYHGIVTLLPQYKKYNIHIAMYILKINYFQGKQKIKYFIQLHKTKITINKLNDNTLSLILQRKNIKQQIKLLFQTIKDASIFQNVLNQNRRNKQQQFSSNVQESSSNSSFDSLKFTVQRMEFNDIFSIADTFDILLFKNKNIMSKFQRFFTNSDFDHVSLIIRTTGNKVLMFQATSNSGVSVSNLQFLRYLIKNKHFSRLALRRYKGSKKDQFIKNLQTFINEVNGKKYKFDPMYLVSSSVSKSQQQTFFCSQLVAQALQIAGIMKKDRPSYKFLPKHFGNLQQLNNEIQQGEYQNIIVIE